MSSVKSSFAIAIGERGLLIAINLISYVLVARLVTPEDVGVFSVASAFVAILAIFRDFGSGYYIATKKDLDQRSFSTAFTFSIIIGLFITVVLFLVAPLVAKFFRDQRVGHLVYILAFNAPLLALTGCLITVLRRNFLYGRVSVVNLVGVLIGSFVTLLLALNGFGAYGLALGVSANYLASAMLVYLLRVKGFELRFGIHCWREVVSFGGKTTTIGVFQQLSTSVLDIAVGKYLGFGEAGLVSRAMGVVNLFIRDFTEAVRGVAMHAFSREIREGRGVAEMHSSFLINYSVVGVFFFSFIFFYPKEVIYVLSGRQWLDAAPYLKLFAVMGVVSVFYQLIPVMAVAAGRVSDLMRVTVFAETLKLLFGCIAIFIVGGAAAYGYAWIVASVVVCLVFWIKLAQMSRKQIRELWLILTRYSLVACLPVLLSLPFVLAFEVLLPGVNVLAAFFLAAALSSINFVLILKAVSHPLYVGVVAPALCRVSGALWRSGVR